MSHETLIKTAQELWEKESKSAAGKWDIPAMPLEARWCPSTGMIETLIDLVAENPTRPVNELAPIIYRMLDESQFVDDGGDSMVCDESESMQTQADVLVKVLDEVRRYGLREGLWCSLPATPLMYG